MTFSRCRRNTTLLSVLLPLCLLAACSRPRQTNVIVISIDTLRADHCSFAGYERPTTPRLDALAAEGIRMTQAYAPTSTTGPTHASLFTSLYPLSHGVLRNAYPLDEKLTTLAEALGDRGYATAAVVSSFVLDDKFGYAQGFGSYDSSFTPEFATISRREMEGHAVEIAFDQTADATTEKALRQLDTLAAGNDPFFLFVHYFDPHYPFVPPAPWDGRFATPGADELQTEIDAYDEEIGFTDEQVGLLLDRLRELGLDERTLVVLTADHGEGLMQHGHMHHGLQIYEELVRVPLLLRLPGTIAAGRTLDTPVSLVDLFPTLFSLLGLAPPDGLGGLDLSEAVTTSAPLAAQRPIFFHRRHYDPGVVSGIPVAGNKFGVRVGRWKYIEGQQERSRELFDLREDPGETLNLVEQEVEIADSLSMTIESWKQALSRGDSAGAISEDDRRALEALGYLSPTPLSVDHDR